MSKEITELQQRILDFIGASLEEKGYPPSIREIGRRLRITSPSSVAYHLRVLEAAGLLKREGAISRGMTLPAPLGLPILGRVAAGSGVIAAEDAEGHVHLDKDLRRGADYILRVKGDSMTGAGIFEGDLVQVRRQDTAQDGEIVVALTADGEEGVVKRLRRKGTPALLSENPAYAPITGPFTVVGKVVGLLRSY